MTVKTGLRMVVSVWLAAGVLAFGDDKGLYFYAPFDGSLKALEAGRETTPTNAPAVAYEAGPVGRSVVIGEEPLCFREADDFPLQQGTLAFWVKPHEDPGKNHWLVRKMVKWDQSPVDGLWFLLGSRRLKAGLSDSTRKGVTLEWLFQDESGGTEWPSNTWKHFALTWGPEGAGFYVNGCLVDASDINSPPARHASTIFLSGISAKRSYYLGRTSVDDFRVYDRPLASREVVALFRLGDPALRTAPPLRSGLREELTASREFSRVFKAFEAANGGNAKTVSELAAILRAGTDAYVNGLQDEDPEFIRGLRREFDGALANVRAIPHVEKPPVCDGDVNDEEWKHAAVLNGFRLLRVRRPVELDTTVRLCHDAEFLYVAGVCGEKPGDAVIATFKDRDDPLWRNDAVQVLIQPSPDSPAYHFIANANGACYDARGGDAGWNGQVRTAALFGRDADRWSFEMAIPFADLKVEPAKGVLFRGNVCRDNIGGQAANVKGGYTEETSVWAPVTTRFNDPDSFGIFVLE